MSAIKNFKQMVNIGLKARKNCFNKFLLKVHPDLFHSEENKKYQLVNKQSLQTLNNLLDEAKIVVNQTPGANQYTPIVFQEVWNGVKLN